MTPLLRGAATILSAIATLTLLSAWQIPSTPGFVPYDPGDGRVLLGLRAMTALAASTHKNAIRIRRASDSTETNITVLSDGSLDVATAGTFCNATTCYATTVYDQSGNTDCDSSSAPCDLTQSTAGQQPELIFSCIGALPCLRFVQASQSCLNTATKNSRAQSQPLTYSIVTKHTHTGVANEIIFGQGVTSVNPTLRGGITAGNVVVRAGTSLTKAATDATWLSWQAVFDGGSSVSRINGSETSGNAGTGNIAVDPSTSGWVINGVGDCSAAWDTQDWAETSYFPSLQDATARAAMETFQRAYWGF